jgi:hypothetical protein
MGGNDNVRQTQTCSSTDFSPYARYNFCSVAGWKLQEMDAFTESASAQTDPRFFVWEEICKKRKGKTDLT